MKTLPPELQSAIAEFAAQKGNTLAKTLKWLRADGTETSIGALSEFLSWYAARQRALHREQRIQAWLELEKLDHPELSDEELFLRGQRKFQILSIADEDPDAWAKIQKTGRDKEQSFLDRQKFKRESLELFVKWFEDKRAKEILSSGSSRAEQIKRLDQLMFPQDHPDKT